MSYQLAADAVLLLHAAFILFAVLGGLLVLRWRRVAYAHIPAVAWAALVEFTGWICPLTPWEQQLRAQTGAVPWQGGFIEHYLMPVLYPDGLTRPIQVLLGAIVLIVNLAIYWRVFRRGGRRPK